MLRRFPHRYWRRKTTGCYRHAFACNPELIIFDEPTTALDILTSKQILELFSELQDETSISALYISHDLGLVSRVAETVSVLKAGETVGGPRTEVFRRPRERYTKALLGSLPNPELLGATEPPAEGRRLSAEEVSEYALSTVG